MEYNNIFDKLMLQLTDIPLKIEMHFYLKGLKKEIRQMIETNKENLLNMMTLKLACLRLNYIYGIGQSSMTGTNSGTSNGTNNTLTTTNNRGSFGSQSRGNFRGSARGNGRGNGRGNRGDNGNFRYNGRGNGNFRYNNRGNGGYFGYHGQGNRGNFGYNNGSGFRGNFRYNGQGNRGREGNNYSYYLSGAGVSSIQYNMCYKFGYLMINYLAV